MSNYTMVDVTLAGTMLGDSSHQSEGDTLMRGR
jgi:hypothetical protein